MPSPSRVRWSVSTSERTISGAESSKMGRSPEKLVARHGLPTISLHKLRYLPASLQIAAGVDTAIVSKRLRHSSIKITNDTYGHMIGTIGRQAAEAAAALVPLQHRTTRRPERSAEQRSLANP